MISGLPVATVGAIITKNENGKQYVLLALRNTEPFKNYWSLPGGHIDRYETAEAAIIREIKEEVGLDLTPRFLFYFDEILPEQNIHAVVNVFAGDARGTIQVAPAEIQAARWVPIHEALQMTLAFFHRDIIQKYVTMAIKDA
ncbi:MAG: NUDIX hydrolase [candidate division KSB1 bacterium]|nr:NUDIX hydrolase [candidate division KSB1 bacterium]MDZ7317941.1 NUDIX hydrolase [candidate division KSB1 bacterium]MDZ7341937.1 NUDIX hydrolase [candidate division KSB1 bacterium]